jgi:hypothetical protein
VEARVGGVCKISRHRRERFTTEGTELTETEHNGCRMRAAGIETALQSEPGLLGALGPLDNHVTIRFFAALRKPSMMSNGSWFKIRQEAE